MKADFFRMATETQRDIAWMAEIEKLFRQFEGASDVEARKTVEDEIRVRLKEYRREFGKTATDPYYKQLEALKRTT